MKRGMEGGVRTWGEEDGDQRREAGSVATLITTHIGLSSPSLSTTLSVSFLLSLPLSLSLAFSTSLQPCWTPAVCIAAL